MATSRGNNNTDILSCPICLEKLNNPKYLPCLHTFCTGCIQTYITSAFGKGNVENINCPICRSISTIPQENCPPKDWAQQLPDNVLILGLLEKEKVQRPDKRCMLCERMGVQSDPCVICLTCSDMLCETCHRYHKASKSSCDHEIRPLSEIDDEESFPKVLNLNKCCKHINEKIKLFCSDHDLPCCSLCISLDHRKCEKVVLIEDAAKQYITDKNVDQIEVDLANYETDMKAIVSHNKECLADFENQYKDKSGIVESVCRDLKHEIEEFEIKKKSELQKLYDQKANDIETHNVILENNLKAISNERKILKVCKGETSDVQIMLEAMKIRKRLEDHKLILQEKRNECKYKYEFLLNNSDDVQQIKNSISAMCKVDIKKTRSDLKLITVDSEKIHRINRFATVTNGWHTPANDIDAIFFTVSREILMVGIYSHDTSDSTNFTAMLTLKLDDTTLSETICTMDPKNAKNNLIEMELKEPVTLKPGNKYNLNFSIKGPLKYLTYGMQGQSNIECDGVVIRFENDTRSSGGRTSVYKGQVPGFLFKIL